MTMLLVMRRSGVRFPKAAQVIGIISPLCSVSVARDGWATDGTCRVSCGRHVVTQGKAGSRSDGVKYLPAVHQRLLGLERVDEMVELLEPGIGVVLAVLGVTW